ncbi:MAG: HAD family phosphatase [Candidatus Dormibacteraeota bacterium]|nr:HAD family phosphatase [Candidatus Dormibacteraeota bacterium]
MRFRALACDYDRTIAREAVVIQPVLDALESVSESGRRLVLVTGRTMAELLSVFTEIARFDRVVVENGALLCDPGQDLQRLLAPPVPAGLVEELGRRGVQPLIVGRGIISTSASNDSVVLATLGDLGLDLSVSYNRNSVMVLPAGVSKATGLRAAAGELEIPLDAVVAVGDGENDIALLDGAGAGVAVENAVASLKERADIVLTRPDVEGVIELCRSLVESDLADLLEASAARA